MIELTDELKDFLKSSITSGVLWFRDEKGDEHHLPLTDRRQELCLTAIISGWLDIDGLTER